jgi:FKBP-type peptidyl-prolyl cis-trans isomerase
LGGLLAAALVLCGCDDVDHIVPVTPPGAVIPKTPPPGDEAQAQGETAVPSMVKSPESTEAIEYTPSPPTAKGETKKTKSGVVYETLKAGDGEELKPGKVAVVHYVGKLENGEEFDSSKSGRPFEVSLGQNKVIKGWEEALPGMRVGEKRRMTIPAELGYGNVPQPKIPANSTLIFEVELMNVR